MTASRRARLYASLLVMAASSPPAVALPPIPFDEIVDILRELVADQLGRKAADIDASTALAAQGCSENDLQLLLTAIEQEFGVVIADDLLQGKSDDSIAPLSVQRLASLVFGRMQGRPAND